MDALKFIEERYRMCHSYHSCAKCPGKEGTAFCGLNVGSGISAKEQVAIVEKWSNEHPRKTRQSVFLEQYPDANLDEEGVVNICPRNIDASRACVLNPPAGCIICRREFWSEEAE